MSEEPNHLGIDLSTSKQCSKCQMFVPQEEIERNVGETCDMCQSFYNKNTQNFGSNPTTQQAAWNTVIDTGVAYTQQLTGNPVCPKCSQFVTWNELFSNENKLCNVCNGKPYFHTVNAPVIQFNQNVLIPEINSVQETNYNKDEVLDLLKKVKIAIEFSIASIMTAVAGFVNDPADSKYQEGYLAALKVTGEEAMQPLADVLPKVNLLLEKINKI